MRLRNVRYAKTKIAAHPEFILDVHPDKKVDLDEVFKDDKPLNIEIGCGKGAFMHRLSEMHPEENFLAIEQFDSVIVRALEKVIDAPRANLYLIRMDAQHLSACMKANAVSTIYLNFSDPWPKVRHAKRRLTHPGFLAIYEKILNKGGTIELKTDNRKFFEFSLKSMTTYGMRIVDLSLDLHNDDHAFNIETEFEAKFKNQGSIYKLTVTFQED